MTEKPGVRFEEAENCKGIVLTAIGIVFALLACLVQSSSTALGAVALVATYMMTGERYQWVYIWRKTFYRDML
jgi:hypothetical protein